HVMNGNDAILGMIHDLMQAKNTDCAHGHDNMAGENDQPFDVDAAAGFVEGSNQCPTKANFE
ncbi:hypothetical protein Droror1_Dr00024478, partial [Drosera rotundifolia]